jgi:hypothetical protein
VTLPVVVEVPGHSNLKLNAEVWPHPEKPAEKALHVWLTNGLRATNLPLLHSDYLRPLHALLGKVIAAEDAAASCGSPGVRVHGATVWGIADDGAGGEGGWRGGYATREEAVAAGRAEYGDAAFWIREGERYRSRDFVHNVNATNIVDRMAEDAADEAGDAAEDWPEVSQAARAALVEALRAWADEHVPAPRFWQPVGESERVPAAPVVGGAP